MLAIEVPILKTDSPFKQEGISVLKCIHKTKVVSEKEEYRKIEHYLSRGGSSALYCKGKISERKTEIETQGQQGLSHLDGYIKAKNM